MTSMVYIEAHRKYGAETLVTVKRNGASFHHSVLVARTDARIKSLRDLKERAVAFVDEKAAAGYVMPRGMLLAEGLALDDLSYYNFTGTHYEVARAVLKGEFNAGGMMESTAKAYREQGLSVLKVSDPVPEWNICSRGVDRSLQQAVQDALLELSETVPEHAAVLHAIDACCTGFVKSADEDHAGMRAVMSRLGML
jgi:ABC-type phosphate/phosphonate transport system substrate-binding protein